jgi:hypothetical protein
MRQWWMSGLMVLGVAGCAGNGAPAMMEGAWRLEGTRLIGCCCTSPCACRINKPPTYMHGCDSSTAVHIDRGHINGVRMDGLNWVVAGLSFAEDTKNNWLVVYLDDRMSAEQEKALRGWMEEGLKAMDPEKLKHLAGAFAGFRRAPIRWTSEKTGDAFRCEIPGIYDFSMKAIRNPGHPEPVTSTGILDDFGNSFVHGETLAHLYKDPTLPRDGWDLKGRQANYASFTLASDLPTTYTIGWGCWSAHKAYGTRDDYQERIPCHPKK